MSITESHAFLLKKIFSVYVAFNFNVGRLHGIGGCPRGVMVKAMDCEIVESEFELQSHYYVHFQTNTLGKSMNPFILPAMG